MKRNSNAPALKWVWVISGYAKLWPVLQTLVRICQSCVAILYAHALGRVVDGAASGNMETFFREFWLFAAYNILSIVLLLLNRYLSERSKNELDKAFRMRAFSQLLHRDYSQVSRTHTGEWMNRITSDTEVIAKAVAQIIPEISGALVRDYTPEHDAGKLQGVRMIFSVLIPMVIGPMIGNAINKAAGVVLENAGADAMTTEYIPVPGIYLAAAIAAVLMFAVIPVLVKCKQNMKKTVEENEIGNEV